MNLKIGDRVCFQHPASIHAKVGYIIRIEDDFYFVEVSDEQKLYKVHESKIYPA